MTDADDTAVRPLLRAVAFAARAHRHQLRKDGRTPYASHPFRVCLVVRHVFGVEDPAVLTAAVLHDTVEDTTADYDEVAEAFGPQVAAWVAVLSKDKRMPEDLREEAYAAALAEADWQVQVCKLGDVFDNLLDVGNTSTEQQAKTVGRARYYLSAIGNQLRPEARRAFEIVSRLVNEVGGSR
jgi:guanosine-3',5'-bis(diphosphate) 3'-pyrophosphohydrolase